MAYAEYHFNLKDHSQWDLSIADLGENPPWDEAAGVVRSDDWQRRWANKQYNGPRPLLKVEPSGLTPAAAHDAAH